MNKKTRAELEAILYHLNRAAAYINSPRTAVCMLLQHEPTTTEDYSNPHKPGTALTPLNKEYGSDLTGLAEAKKRIERLLAPKKEAPIEPETVES